METGMAMDKCNFLMETAMWASGSREKKKAKGRITSEAEIPTRAISLAESASDSET